MRAMSQDFGREAPSPHAHTAHRAPARFLVLIESEGEPLARLFLATREQVAELDAGTEEVAQMTRGLAPAQGAEGPEWDRALAGHSADERRTARVYTLDL